MNAETMGNAKHDLNETIGEIEHALVTLRDAQAATTTRDFKENVADAADMMRNIAAQLRDLAAR